MQDVQVAEAAASAVSPQPRRESFWALALGSVGVVFGDIGTSPLYAVREALSHARGGATPSAVFGVVSLVFWALILVVTVKYVIFIMRADNKGEGGTLALMALAQRALGDRFGRHAGFIRRSNFVFVLGICGAALFYGDGLITPAISVLSAAEGLKDAPTIGHLFEPFVLPIAAAILVALFMVQSRGTASVGRYFGPITLVWFATLAGLGVVYIAQKPEILLGLSPWYGVRLLVDDGLLGFAILGSVFLVVTGAEALYADMGHFGKGPIRAAWLGVAFPCLMLNYLGQGALVLLKPATQANPFYLMIPQAIYWPVLGLTIVATVIASQAVISGAYSMTQQAVQLGLLPRIDIRRTSETVAGQIFVPQINTLLMIGVLALLFVFRNSSNLASAYGIAVTGTMVITMLLAYVVARHHWKWRRWATMLFVVPLISIDLVFLSANAMKIPQGGWFPLAFGGGLLVVFWTWIRGAEILSEKARRDAILIGDVAEMLRTRDVSRAAGTAVFLTSDPDVAPVALMHNLKHNKVLHDQNVILTVRTAETPRVADAERVRIEPINDRFRKVFVTYGFMETPNIPRALALCRKKGLKFDIMATSFFLGRRSVVPSAHAGMPLWQDKIFIYLMKNAANPTDFYKIPPGRVVEMGAQVTV
ncbi:MAG: potassium transporter Kup [Phenylobacterium sp.]|uniref:potassium transporter Kup n=1 Tax=Phenylobacterium sp. TaxID=1871053 RepID=UPI0025CF7AF8|nr:potassium transporter Kup [Phenylobacterium sp.]MBI1198296.1 potassium transporter Kup [Phenylobacterium sp.]